MKEWMIEKLDAKSLLPLKDKLTSMIIIFGADAQAKIGFLYGSKPLQTYCQSSTFSQTSPTAYPLLMLPRKVNRVPS